MSTILQRIRNRSASRLARKTKSPALEGAPFVKGVCMRVFTRAPKKTKQCSS